MGYETKAFVVERYNFNKIKDNSGPEMLHTLGMVDLSKDGDVDSFFSRLRLAYTENTIEDNRSFGLWAFGYNGSGDEHVCKDKYNKPIVLIPINDAILNLEYDLKKEYYRRFDMLLQLLKATKKGFEKNINDLYVACYGH